MSQFTVTEKIEKVASLNLMECFPEVKLKNGRTVTSLFRRLTDAPHSMQLCVDGAAFETTGSVAAQYTAEGHLEMAGEDSGEYIIAGREEADWSVIHVVWDGVGVGLFGYEDEVASAH